ncbi:MAG: conjugal transfer protein [Pseudomonadales bacterium]
MSMKLHLHFEPYTWLLRVSIMGVLLSGCSSTPVDNKGPSLSSVYDSFYQKGRKDTVQTLRAGLRMDFTNGVRDPYIPIRNPDVIAPVWVVPYESPYSDVKHEGHWKWIVTEEATWSN